MNRNFCQYMREAQCSLFNGEHQLHGRHDVGRANQHARQARTFLALARMELAREVVREIDTGNGIATPAQWALATKILKPLRLSRTTRLRAAATARQKGGK